MPFRSVSDIFRIHEPNSWTYRVLKCYHDYYKDDPRQSHLLMEQKDSNPRGNGVANTIEQDLMLFFGSQSVIEKQTLYSIIFEPTKKRNTSTVGILKKYCVVVEKVLKARGLKTHITTSSFLNANQKELLSNRPIYFVDKLSDSINKELKRDPDSELKKDLEYLFTDKSKHYKIKNDTIEILEEYLSKVNSLELSDDVFSKNSIEQLADLSSDKKEIKTIHIDTGNVTISSKKTILSSPGRFVLISIVGVIITIVAWMSGFTGVDKEECCLEFSSQIQSISNSFLTKKSLDISQGDLKEMLLQIRQKSCGNQNCELGDRLDVLYFQVLSFISKRNKLEEQQIRLEKDQLSTFSKENINTQIAACDLLIEICGINKCPEDQIKKVNNMRNQLRTL